MGKASSSLGGVSVTYLDRSPSTTGIPAKTRNLHLVTSSKIVLGKGKMGSGADESKSFMFCPRISVLPLTCPSEIGNELYLDQSALRLNTNIIWQQWRLAQKQPTPHPEALGGILVSSPANFGRRVWWLPGAGNPLGCHLTKEPFGPGWAVPGPVSIVKSALRFRIWPDDY